MNVRFTVELTIPEREALRELLGRGCPRVRKVKRAQILLAADEGADRSADRTDSVGRHGHGLPDQARLRRAGLGARAAGSAAARGCA